MQQKPYTLIFCFGKVVTWGRRKLIMSRVKSKFSPLIKIASHWNLLPQILFWDLLPCLPWKPSECSLILTPPLYTNTYHFSRKYSVESAGPWTRPSVTDLNSSQPMDCIYIRNSKLYPLMNPPPKLFPNYSITKKRTILRWLETEPHLGIWKNSIK